MDSTQADALPQSPASAGEVERKLLEEAVALIDEINERAVSRAFNGISQVLHAKLCTVRATIVRASKANAVLTPPAQSSDDGYRDAFYELAALMGMSAQIISPAQAWREQMLPRLRAALTPDTSKEGADAWDVVCEPINGVAPFLIPHTLKTAMAVHYCRAMGRDATIDEGMDAAVATWETNWESDPTPRNYSLSIAAVDSDLEHWDD